MAQLLNLPNITTAVANGLSSVFQLRRSGPINLTLQANFIRGSGGTTVDAWVQTSTDGGANWTDIAQFSFTTSTARRLYNLSSLTPVTTVYTPTDGALAANTAKDGIVGDQFRVKYTTVGTYGGNTSLSITASGAPLTAL